MASNLPPPPLTWLRHVHAFAHVRKNLRIVHALAPNILMVPFDEIMTTFCLFHPLANVDLPLFVNDFYIETEVILNQKVFFFLLWHIHHIFHLIVLWVWCMNFYERFHSQLGYQKKEKGFNDFCGANFCK
jgi:hypothetical protein